MMDDDIRVKMLDVAEWLREQNASVGYGYAITRNPHDFTPDPECSTAAERERHRSACEAWDRGAFDVSAAAGSWGAGTYEVRDLEADRIADYLTRVATQGGASR